MVEERETGKYVFFFGENEIKYENLFGSDAVMRGKRDYKVCMIISL